MSNVSTSLNYLLSLKAEYNNDIVEQMKWSQLQKNNAGKLSKMETRRTKWQDAYDDATNVDKTVKLKSGAEVAHDNKLMCRRYADEKAGLTEYEIDEQLDILEDYDVQYTQMQALFETKVEQEKAEIEKLEQLTSEGAQDTGMLGQ